MRRRVVLLLLKPLDVYPPRFKSTTDHTHARPLPPPPPTSATAQRRITNRTILKYLDDRCRIHKETINFCQEVLQKKSLDWMPVWRNDLSQPIRHVDLVISVGGDGTLLQSSHFMDNTIPIVGVNSDPTRINEVEEFSTQYDATRSTGYLCAATAETFEQVLDEILEDKRVPSQLSRILVKVNGSSLPVCALNDILVAHPCPASVSHFSFSLRPVNDAENAPVHCRSSGLRICTAAGSTAAMRSAGGFRMPILSQELQYMVREPILPMPLESGSRMHGFVEPDQSMQISWYSREGDIYIDGSHVFHSIQHGDTIEVSSKAPGLNVHLPPNLLHT